MSPLTRSAPVTGTPVARVDGRAKVTGEARYAYEHLVEGAVYAWPVSSTIARGRVTALDVSTVLGRPEVIDVLHPGNAARLSDTAGADLMVLQSDDVRFRGQIVAAVIATSLEAARAAAAQVVVSYDEEPHDVLLHTGDGSYVPETVNDLSPGQVERGDAEQAYSAAPVHLDRTYRTPPEHASPMEPHATIAEWRDGRLTLHNADQGPFMSAQALAGVFGLAVDDVEVVAEHVGGGFGSKASPRPPTVLAALAAKLVGRPVKVALTRPQMSALTTYRTPTEQRVRLGAERDGRIVSIIHDSLSQTSRITEFAENTTSSTRVLYDVADVRTTVRVLPLDVPTPGWYRAPGHTPGMYALECAVDELAVELGVDPVELRIRNEPTMDPETGKAFSSRGLVAALREGAERFGWATRDPRPGVRRHGRWVVGTGVAAAHYPALTFPSTARVRADADGSFTVLIAAVDIGTGARTVLSQLAADALAVPIERIRLVIGRSSLGNAPFAGGSIGTASWGWAVEKACAELLRRLGEHEGGLPVEGIEVFADTTEDVASLADLSRHGFGAQFAQVRVDVDTGQVGVDRLLGVFANGRVVNPRTARSQAVGGMIQGLSMALLEVAEVDGRFGDFVNHDLGSYHVASHADVGDVDAVHLQEDDEHLNSIGGKGVGEIGIVGVAAAVANAVHHATGLRVRDLPIRIEDVRSALPGLRAT